MVAQPQPPHGGGASHRLRALIQGGQSPHGSGGSGSGSGALVAPVPPERPPERPPAPRQSAATRHHAAPHGNVDDEDDDLAPTLPSIPSMPRITAMQPAATRLRVCADFAAFVLARNYIHGPRLDGLTTEQRMRLFNHIGRIYLPALQLAGRMASPSCDDDDADGQAG